MKKSLLIIFSFFLFFSAKAQVVDSMMQVYAESFPQQKIHMHLDKSAYRAGETVWFKAYLLEGFSLAVASTNFYAELIDANGKVVERKVYPIIEASAAGFFDIAPNMPATKLTLRAYTTWMLNFDTSFIYEKPITILNQAGNADPAMKQAPVANATNIHFFPEGGNLVSELESVVAYKANDNAGLPIAVSGSIVDSKGTVASTFKSEHNGMGRFSFTPLPGETYTARYKDSTGIEKSKPLPLAIPLGVVLTLKVQRDKVLYTLVRSDNVPEEMSTLHLVAHVAQTPVFKARILLKSSFMTGGMIPVKDIPSGVMQVTVFNSKWEPLAERIVMVNNKQHEFDVNLTAPLVSTEKRARNVVELEVKDTLLTNMSLSVTDAMIGHHPFEDNIISRMLLTGDVKGYVHEPAYYFSNDSDSAFAHLDLVMLTHGWRRYNWADVVNKKLPKLTFLPDSALMLQAKVFGLGGGTRLQADEQLLAIIESKDSARVIVMLPKVGADVFAMPITFFDTVKVHYQFQKDRKLESSASVLLTNNFYKGKPQVKLQSPYLLPPSEVTIDRIKLLASELSKYKSSFNVKGNVLETVTVRTRVKTKLEQMDEKYAFGLFRGIDGQGFDMTEGNNNLSQNIFSFLMGRVPGITISDAMGMNPSVSWRGVPTSLFLDETPVDAGTLSSINVNDIAYVKVFRPPFMGASGGGPGGGIVVYTKKGNDMPKQTGVGLSKSSAVGYSISKEFYSPDYSDRTAEVAADFRSTLYWQPYIFTGGGNKKVKFEFYNNDISKAFRIVLEGVNEIGKLVRIEKVVER